MSIMDELDDSVYGIGEFSVDDILSEFGFDDTAPLPYTDEEPCVPFEEDSPEMIVPDEFLDPDMFAGPALLEELVSGNIPAAESAIEDSEDYQDDLTTDFSNEAFTGYPDEDYVSPYTVDSIVSSEPALSPSFRRPSAAELNSFLEDFHNNRYLDDIDDFEEEPETDEPEQEPVPADTDSAEVNTEEIESTAYSDFSDHDENDSSYDEFDSESKSSPLAGIVSGIKGSKLLGKLKRENREKDDFVLADNERPKPILRGEDEYEGDEFDDYTNPASEFSNGKPFSDVSFKDYLSSILMTVLYKLRGAASVVLTMEDVVEELGPEMPPKKAFKYYGNNIRPMKLRLLVCAVLLLFMGWISLGLPVTGMLKSAKTASAVVLGMQLTVMLLCLDVVTNALLNASRGRLGHDSVVVIACIASSLDAFLVAVSTFVTPHIALCFMSSLSLTGVLYADMLTCCGLRKAIRVPAIGKKINVMRAEYDEKENKTNLIRAEGNPEGFVRRSEETPPDENRFSKMSIALFAAAFLFAVICAVTTHDIKDLMYFISLFLCVAAPVCGLICFPLPFLIGSNKIFSSGAGICGWSGVYDIGHSDKLIVTDNDIFPAGTIKLGSYRIYRSSDERRILSYAASILKRSGSSLAHPFIEKAEELDCELFDAMNFTDMAGGGYKAIIDSKVILCGSSDFMHLMNVPILANHITETSVLLAVNNELCGIFNMEYSRSHEIKHALAKLIALSIDPVFAVRDFNITPRMLSETFELPTHGYIFPPFGERFQMTEGISKEPAALNSVICRDGLSPLVNTIATGRNIYRIVTINTAIVSIGTALCMLAVLIKLIASGAIAMSFLLTLALLLTIPVLILSLIV